jgi:hypothetical protein
LALLHLAALRKMISFNKELVLFDRGYHSFSLFEYCESVGIYYLMRVRKKFNLDIDKMKLGIHIYFLTNHRKTIMLKIMKLKL